MNISITQTKCIITRDSSDKKIYKDSTLMHHIKKELVKLGYDVITKDLSKEPGNMLSTGCYGIIARDRSFQMYYPRYCINDAYKDYNSGTLELYINP